MPMRVAFPVTIPIDCVVSEHNFGFLAESIRWPEEIVAWGLTTTELAERFEQVAKDYLCRFYEPGKQAETDEDET